jgi:hypothetical protein
MYMLLKKDLAHHNPMLKLTAFKIVVGLTLLQEVSYSRQTTTRNAWLTVIDHLLDP